MTRAALPGARPRFYRRRVRQVLRNRQVIGLIAFVLVIVPLFLVLSRWQFNRWDERRAYNSEIEAGVGASAVDIDRLVQAGESTDRVDPELEYRLVNVAGRYDATGQVLVRRRPLNTSNGFWVITPFTTAAGATLLVNRGWVPAGRDATSTPSVPPPAAGATTLTGRIRLTEGSDGVARTDVPAGQITALVVPDVLGTLNARGYPVYVELVTSSPPPAEGITLLPAPEISDGNHLSYAIQWIFFAVMAVGGLIYLMVLEVRRRREIDEAAAAERDNAASERDTQMGDATAS